MVKYELREFGMEKISEEINSLQMGNILKNTLNKIVDSAPNKE